MGLGTHDGPAARFEKPWADAQVWRVSQRPQFPFETANKLHRVAFLRDAQQELFSRVRKCDTPKAFNEDHDCGRQED
jgi:hypothetical protein